MNILFTICARAGSKGLKSKNTRDFCGKPLVTYTLKAYELFCQEYGDGFGKITLAVNTDSNVLIEQLNLLEVDYIYISRKEELAGDVVSKISVIYDTMVKVEEKQNMLYDIVIDLDLTSPFRTVADIYGTLDMVLKNPDADISFSVTDSRRSPYFNMVCEKENGYFDRVINATYVSRQQVPVCYDMNASIYAYRRDYLLSGREGDRTAVIWKMRDTAVLDIDSEDDMELMELLAPYYWNKYEDYIR